MPLPRRRTAALLAAALASVASVVPLMPASALAAPVAGTFLCQNSLSIGGVAGTSAAGTQVLSSTITAPATSDIGAPGAASVALVAAAGSTLPTSPGIALPGVVLTQVDVRLDIYVTTTNSPATIAGAPTAGAIGSNAVAQSLGTVNPSTAWPTVTVSTQLPVGVAGQRQWLRLKQISYRWTTSDGAVGSTDCRLVGAIQSEGSGGIVTAPVYSFVSPLSLQYPESATYPTAGSVGFASFGARTTVTDVSGAAAPPSSSCTVTDPSGCTTGQQVTATVIAGTLSQQAAGHPTNPSSTAVTLRREVVGSPFTGDPSVTVAAAPQVMEGALNPVTVTDVRGGTAGWSLTAALSGPFAEVGGGQIAESAATMVVSGCTPVTGSATRTTGTGGALSSAVTLCGVDPGIDDSEGQSGGGQYTVTGAVKLTVPAFQKAGEYASTLVITLT